MANHNSTNLTYGLIGERLGHSFSPFVHQRLGKYAYNLIELPPSQLKSFIESKNFLGLNVTIPYKSQILPYIDVLDPIAEEIGAINTVVKKDNLLYGYNADLGGFESLLNHNNISLANKNVLILGTGGTAKMAQVACKRGKAKTIFVASRQENLNLKNATPLTYQQVKQKEIAKQIQIVINTTPCGMYPNNQETPLDLSQFTNLVAVVDAIFNPLNTRLIQQGKTLGINHASGLFMLIAQAGLAVQHFTGKQVPQTEILATYNDLKASLYNLVLIGMPSCGKTTLGKILAKNLNKTFVDVDAVICQKTKLTIPQFFAAYGEAEFRKLETETIQELSKQTGLVIATGGGSVLAAENIINLKQNGILAFINRPLNLLQGDENRPLAQNQHDLQKLYVQRLAIYQKSCHFQIENQNQSLEQIASAIKQGYEQEVLASQ